MRRTVFGRESAREKCKIVCERERETEGKLISL